MRKAPKRKNGVPAPRTGSRRRLDDDAIKRVCELIGLWTNPPLTWEALTERVSEGGRVGWTRQTLAGNVKIAEAFDRKKVDLRSGKSKLPRDPALVILRRDIEERDAQILRLKDILRSYEERFLVMIRNASVRGISQDELEHPLIPIDRKSI